MKLPDIKPWAVPEFKSGKAAALPNQLRNINAAVQVVSGVTNKLQTVLDNEDKLDANRRFQRAQVDYMEEQSDLVQEYHTTDKPLTDFGADMRKLRDRTYTNARNEASGRATKYLQGKLDAFEVKAAAVDVKTLTSLAESRSIMHIEKAHQDALTMVSKNRFATSEALAAMDENLTSNGLSTAYNQEQRTTQTAAILLESLRGHLAADDMTAAVKMPGTAAWQNMPQGQRLSMEAAIQKQSLEALDAHTQETANSLLIGGGDLSALQTELDKIPGMVENETLLEGKTADDSVQGYQGEMANWYFQGQLLSGEIDAVEDALKTGDYNQMLSTSQTKQLLAGIVSARNASNTDKDLYKNGSRARSKNAVKEIITAYNEHPATTEASYNAAIIQLDGLMKDYTDHGDTIPEEVTTLRLRLDRARDDAAVTLSVWRDPGAATAHVARFSGDTVEDRRQREVAQAALISRADALGTDAIEFVRELGVPVAALPAPLTEGYLEALSLRIEQHAALLATYGDDISGPLSAGEADDLFTFLSMGSTEDEAAIAGAFNSELGQENSLKIWDQLATGEDTGIMPVVGRLSAQGRQGIAVSVRQGSDWLDTKGSSLRPDEITKVNAGIAEELGSAYGYGAGFYNRNSRAILAHYTTLTGAPDNRGDFSYNEDRMKQAVKDVTGGILEVNGQQFVAPVPGMHPAVMERWWDSLDETNLPAVADGTGKTIPAEELAKGIEPGIFASRFTLVETGVPGKYYISDSRSLSTGGTGGGLLFEAGKKGPLATVTFDPSIIKPAKPLKAGGIYGIL